MFNNKIAFLFIATISPFSIALAQSSDVTLSKSDIKLLKKIDKMERISKNGRFLLSIYPLNILMSSNPTSLSIKVNNSDYAAIGSGLKNIKAIEVCTIANLIDYHIAEFDGSSNTEDFFRKIHSSYEKSCDALSE